MAGPRTFRADLLRVMAFSRDIAIGFECCCRNLLPHIIRKSSPGQPNMTEAS